MKKLIIIRGPLGVGKTTISKVLAHNLHLEYLSVDQIIEDNKLIPINTDGIPVESYLKVNQIVLDLIKNSEDSFILDGCFYYQEQIDDLKNKFNNNIEIFTLISSVDKCIERDSKRSKVYGEDSARFVYSITTNIKMGYEIDNTNLTIEETVKKIQELMH
jgi:shikimate kinase